MKRKILAALLTVAMTASLLAGCGGAAATGGDAGAAAPAADAAAPAADTAAPAADAAAPAADAGSGEVQEITWMFWDDLDATEDLISKGYKEVLDRF
ncbi:MAG: hypothetical protein IJ857_09920, partial [Lachnospiraceae bacterium]|nr:hypothetical protein [Lachnospiraceae bacterium]